jgi:hypothetical protein
LAANLGGKLKLVVANINAVSKKQLFYEGNLDVLRKYTKNILVCNKGACFLVLYLRFSAFANMQTSLY